MTQEEQDTLSADELAILKSDRSLKLVIASHEFLTPSAKFATAVAALETAADALGHTEWISIIDSEARATGFR